MNTSEDMFEEFRVEMVEIALEIDETMLRWESYPDDPELPNRIFRQMHTLKGSAGFLELQELANLCHAVEDVFALFRAVPRPATNEELTLLNEAIALIRATLDSANGRGDEDELRRLTARVQAMASGETLSEVPAGTENTRSRAGSSPPAQSPEGRASSSAGEAAPAQEHTPRRSSRRRPAYAAQKTPAPNLERAATRVKRRPADERTRPSSSPEILVGSDNSTLMGSRLLSTAAMLEPGGFSLGPWSAERLDALHQGRRPSELRAELEPRGEESGAFPGLSGGSGGFISGGGSTGSFSGGSTGSFSGALSDGSTGSFSGALSDGSTGVSAGHSAGVSAGVRGASPLDVPRSGLETPRADLEVLRRGAGARTAERDPGAAPTGLDALRAGIEAGRAAREAGSRPEAIDPFDLLLQDEAATASLISALKDDQHGLEGEVLFPDLEAAGAGFPKTAQLGPSRRALRAPRGSAAPLPPPETYDIESEVTVVDVPVPGAIPDDFDVEDTSKVMAIPSLEEAQAEDEESGASGRNRAEVSGSYRIEARDGAESGPEDGGLFIERAATVRVDVDKLDNLLNLLGDLLQEKHRQADLVDTLMRAHSRDETVLAMSASHHRLDRLLGALQDAVLGTRMLPVQGVFRRYPRIVKDLAARLGKEVELVLVGEETELDRALLEGLFDPLIHLLRNSIDHGIELPQERMRRNKPRKGTIALSAAHEGNQIVLEIRDDGKGIDPLATGQRATALKLLDPDRLKEMNDQEKVDLIFLPGFTSRSSVTETSGRGVGMSVVRDHLRRIGGLITVHSRAGEGTTLRIVMPLTLAILQILLVRMGNARYAIPLSSVVGVQRVHRDRMTLYRGGWYLPRPGSMLPLFSLGVLLGLETPALPPERCYVAEVGVAEKRYGIWVDGFVGIYESVIKSLEGSLTRLPGVAGGTFIGGGELVLVLDVGTLLEGQVVPGR